MENASKALIIAGAILISILLISVGIMVMNSINQPLEEAKGQGASQAAQIFNSRFTKYEGVQTAANVRSLIQEINASNSANQRHVTLVGNYTNAAAPAGAAATVTTAAGSAAVGTYTVVNINNSWNYVVTIYYNRNGANATEDSGYITGICINRR